MGTLDRFRAQELISVRHRVNNLYEYHRDEPSFLIASNDCCQLSVTSRRRLLEVLALRTPQTRIVCSMVIAFFCSLKAYLDVESFVRPSYALSETELPATASQCKRLLCVPAHCLSPRRTTIRPCIPYMNDNMIRDMATVAASPRFTWYMYTEGQ